MIRFSNIHRSGLARTLHVLLCIAIVLPLAALASAGKVVIAQGEAYALGTGNEQRPLSRRSDVLEGDTLVTGTDGQLQIRFNDNAILSLNPNSRLRISEYHRRDANNNQEQVLMDLLSGGFRTITGRIGSTNRDAYQVRTPNASIGIRGTHYEAQLADASLLLGVYEGGIVVSNANGTLNLGLDANFLFARIDPGRAPRGLLEPPAGLNLSRVPATGEPGQTTPDEEPEAQLEGVQNEGLPLDQAFGGNEPPPIIPVLAPLDTNTGYVQLTKLDEDINELGNLAATFDIPPDVRLTTEQQQELARGPGKGFIVLTDSDGDAVHFVYRVDGDNGPVLINYDTETLTELDNGYASPDRVYKGPTLTAPESLTTLQRENQTVEWGIWNASTTDPATLLESSTTLTDASLDTTPFFYVFAEPADITALTGSRNLNLCSDQSCIDVFASNGESLSSATGYLDVNFTDLSATSGLTLNMSSGSWWEMYFSGVIKGSQLSSTNLFIDLGGQGRNESSYNLGDESETFTDLSGEFQGLFIDGANQTVEFVGGFGVSSESAGESISGVYLMSGSGSETDTTPQ